MMEMGISMGVAVEVTGFDTEINTVKGQLLGFYGE